MPLSSPIHLVWSDDLSHLDYYDSIPLSKLKLWQGTYLSKHHDIGSVVSPPGSQMESFVLWDYLNNPLFTEGDFEFFKWAKFWGEESRDIFD